MLFPPFFIVFFVLLRPSAQNAHFASPGTIHTLGSPRAMPQIHLDLEDSIKENGFVFEVIGQVGDQSFGNGLLKIDYSDYVKGSIYEKMVDEYLANLLRGPSMFAGIRKKMATEEISSDRKTHLAEMQTMFRKSQRRVRSTDTSGSGEQEMRSCLQSSLKKKDCEPLLVVPHYVLPEKQQNNRFFNDRRNVNFASSALSSNEDEKSIFDTYGKKMDRIAEQLKENWAEGAEKMMDSINETAIRLYKEFLNDKLTRDLGLIRSSIRRPLEKALDDLFNKGIFNRHWSQGTGLWIGLENLFGPGFSKSVLSLANSMRSLRGHVLAMDGEFILVQVTYSVTMMEDVIPLVRLEAMGEYANEGKIFRFPMTHRLFGAPFACRHVNCLIPYSEKCISVGRISLCERMEKTRLGCPTVHAERGKKNTANECSFQEIPVTNHFLFIRPLLTKMIVATDSTQGHLDYGNGTAQTTMFNSSLFEISLPEESSLTIYSRRINSRIASAVGTLYLNDLPSMCSIPLETGAFAGIQDVVLHPVFFSLTIVFAYVMGFAVIFTIIYKSYKERKEKNGQMEKEKPHQKYIPRD